MRRGCNKIVKSKRTQEAFTEKYKPKIRGIKNKEEKSVQTEEEIKEVWINYFKEILNEEQAAEEIIIATGEESMEIEEPTLEEVRQIISRSRNAKPPDADKVSVELLKYSDESLNEQMHK
ncbi:hypothetical protein ILUMI_24327 [Ignelater luminosus]|uniref:Uncharacterized protein n=1 Tax=Ignelater luminosus TaxID=2038154 RepID=A0A8K0FYV1_IGNLU|nr:hypothetical protein ILUMI_24327 [Ignelater luminosus]